MSVSSKSSSVKAEAVVMVASSKFANQQHTGGLEISFDPTSTTDFNSSLKVSRTDSSANFSASLDVARDVQIPTGSIDSVLVGSNVFTEASGIAHASASGTVVTVSGSIPSGTTAHNVSIDFAEGDRSTKGGLQVAGDGTFSATHTYSYPGIFHITTRVQSEEGSVDMDSFRLNMASDLSGTDLGGLTITATPESGSTTDSSPLSVSFSASGSNGVSISGDDDKNLIWRLGNLESSSKTSPSTRYVEPGKYVPVAIYFYEGSVTNLYLSDITDTGANG
jgi:hypothetical protein